MTDFSLLLAPVESIIRRVSASIIEPRFRALTADQVIEKRPGDVVTIADREAESALGAAFELLLPGVPVVGEEAVSADPSVLSHLDTASLAWIVDPIDGTKNFVNGSVDHAVMVALVENHRPKASWIWYPDAKVMLTATAGGGVHRNGEPVERIERGERASDLSGVVKAGFAPQVIRAAIKKRQAGFGMVNRGRGCAGVEYADVVAGRRDFILYGFAHPWDHLPGSLMITELGGHVAHLDGAPYTPTSRQVGLLIAASAEVWTVARRQLFG